MVTARVDLKAGMYVVAFPQFDRGSRARTQPEPRRGPVAFRTRSSLRREDLARHLARGRQASASKAHRLCAS
jgi:hypothetical protein